MKHFYQVIICIFVVSFAYAAEEQEVIADTNGQAVNTGKAAEASSVQPEEPKKKEYDLSLLPDNLREKVEKYLKDQEKIEQQIERYDSMAQATSNEWARNRATGIATKLNYELKNLRLLRREIIRDYRELLRDGWEPPKELGNFENLFFSSRS